MEWIEVCIYIELVHVFYPLQSFDEGDSHWKSSDFPRDHNCPAGQRYCEHFTQRKSACKRHCDECPTVDQLARAVEITNRQDIRLPTVRILYLAST